MQSRANDFSLGIFRLKHPFQFLYLHVIQSRILKFNIQRAAYFEAQTHRLTDTVQINTYDILFPRKFHFNYDNDFFE